MQIYIDAEYKCHAAAGDGLRAFEVPALDGKCRTYIEGMRYVPSGEAWTRADGVVFGGEMLSPRQDAALLAAAQGAYEDGIAQLQPQLDSVLVALVAG